MPHLFFVQNPIGFAGLIYSRFYWSLERQMSSAEMPRGELSQPKKPPSFFLATSCFSKPTSSMLKISNPAPTHCLQTRDSRSQICERMRVTNSSLRPSRAVWRPPRCLTPVKRVNLERKVTRVRAKISHQAPTADICEKSWISPNIRDAGTTTMLIANSV